MLSATAAAIQHERKKGGEFIFNYSAAAMGANELWDIVMCALWNGGDFVQIILGVMKARSLFCFAPPLVKSII